MKRIAAVLIVVGIAFAETACVSVHTQGSAGQPPPCDGNGECRIEVATTLCVITANPSTQNVTKRNGIDIFWYLDPKSAYRFHPTDGIKMKPGQPDGSEFGDAQWLADGKTFRLHDKNSRAQPGQKTANQYSITLQLQGIGGLVNCNPFDPTIINEG